MISVWWMMTVWLIREPWAWTEGCTSHSLCFCCHSSARFSFLLDFQTCSFVWTVLVSSSSACHLMSCCFPIGCSVVAHRGRSALWDALIKSLTLSWFFTHYITTHLSWFQILTVYIQLKGFDNRRICWSHDTCQNPLSSPKCDLSLLYYLNCISFGKSFVNICCRIICLTSY